MMIAAAEPAATAIDAERAFARDAMKDGQWTAFRRYAADDALMFSPQPVNAQTLLKDLKDPPVAVFWWPGQSYVSCDRTMAVNTGPWVRGFGKAVGYFTTVWKRQADGSWKWIYDGGDSLNFARGEGGDIAPTKAACTPAPKAPPAVKLYGGDSKSGEGGSGDGTLRYMWQVKADGAREFHAWLWDGNEMQPVIEDKVAAPKE